jgi:hypothetical protein
LAKIWGARSFGTVLVVLGRIKVRAVGRDAGQDWYVAAAHSVEGPQSVPGQQLGRAHEARYRVAVGITRSDPEIDDGSQRIMCDVAGHGAVIVILGDDDVGRVFPAELAELSMKSTVLVLHRTRELLVRQRTMLVNGLCGHMAEFGIIAPQGIQRVDEPVAMLKEDSADGAPGAGRRRGTAGEPVGDHPAAGQAHRRLVPRQRRSAAAGDHPGHRSDHRLGAGGHDHGSDVVQIRPPSCSVLGLMPRQHSTGGKAKLGRITKIDTAEGHWWSAK